MGRIADILLYYFTTQPHPETHIISDEEYKIENNPYSAPYRRSKERWKRKKKKKE
jgi:hypothetical protein